MSTETVSSLLVNSVTFLSPTTAIRIVDQAGVTLAEHRPIHPVWDGDDWVVVVKVSRAGRAARVEFVVDGRDPVVMPMRNLPMDVTTENGEQVRLRWKVSPSGLDEPEKPDRASHSHQSTEQGIGRGIEAEAAQRHAMGPSQGKDYEGGPR